MGSAPRAAAGPCDDPTPDDGGEPAWFGLGTPNHIFVYEGHVCPGVAEEWTVSAFALPGAGGHSLGAKVTRLEGAISITVEPQWPWTPSSLASGEEFRVDARDNEFSYVVRITGAGSSLAQYRLQLCDAIKQACVFGEVPSPGPGDANCDGNVNALDAQAVFAFVARLTFWPPCLFQAQVNPGDEIDVRDGAIILQFVAGLIDELPVP